jgi:hypothetical protein
MKYPLACTAFADATGGIRAPEVGYITELNPVRVHACKPKSWFTLCGKQRGAVFYRGFQTLRRTQRLRMSERGVKQIIICRECTRIAPPLPKIVLKTQRKKNVLEVNFDRPHKDII